MAEAKWQADWTCTLCGYKSQPVLSDVTSVEENARAALAKGDAGRAMQLVQAGLENNPDDVALSALKSQIDSHLSALRVGNSISSDSPEALAEAENYAMQAMFVLHQVQANIQVYGSNSMLTGASPANVDLGLQYINRSLELFPDNPIYLNTKALLLSDGQGNKADAKVLLERAASIAPRDINIQNNLKAVSGGGCFIATAAFGTPFSEELNVLRDWRDQSLNQSSYGRLFIQAYYATSPRIADFIRRHAGARAATRILLRPLVDYLKGRSS